jgi:hypothetical protein
LGDGSCGGANKIQERKQGDLVEDSDRGPAALAGTQVTPVRTLAATSVLKLMAMMVRVSKIEVE